MQDSATPPFSQEPTEPEPKGEMNSASRPTSESESWSGAPTTPLETPATPPPSTWIPEYPPYTGYPPLPPYGSGTPPTARPGSSGGRRWVYALATIALLVALGIGTGIGAAIATLRNASTHPATIGAQSAPVTAVASNVNTLQQTVENVAKVVAPSVVEITSVAGNQEAIGSGDILTANGYIVTNDHVVDGFTSYTVTLSNGTRLQAQLVGQDPQDDLAVIKVSANNLQPIAFADSSRVTVGEFAIAVGNPLGLRESATFGIVSATNRTESESPDGPAAQLTGLIQTSAPIAPGNSGGALVNLQGQLIGMPTLGASTNQRNGSSSSTSIGFAIASNEVKTVAQQLIQSGHVTSTGHAFLGIRGEDVTPALAAADGLATQSGVLIAGFANDAAGQSPAQQAGLQSGDVIVAVNGQSIGDSNDLASAIAGQQPGTQITLTIDRGTSQLTIKATLGERPTS
jgi:S1-C subfamily serine protease